MSNLWAKKKKKKKRKKKKNNNLSNAELDSSESRTVLI